MGQAANTEGRTVLYVSHNMNTIRQLCTRCVVLDQGRVIYDGNVEEAIAVYMQNEIRSLSDDVDLSSMKRIGKQRLCRMERFQFTNPGGPILKPRERIHFHLHLNSECIFDDMRWRCMAIYADGTPVAMATTSEGDMHLTEGQNCVDGTIDVSCIAPGAYSLRLALYRTNELGGEEQFDVIDRAVQFSIDDTGEANHMAWIHSSWGHVSLNNITLN